MITTDDLVDAGHYLTKQHKHHALTLAALLDTTEQLLVAALPRDPMSQGVLRDTLAACIRSRCQDLGITPQAVQEARQGLHKAQATLAYLDGLPA